MSNESSFNDHPHNRSHMGPLGQVSAYADQYDPALLFAVPRAPKRAEIGIQEPLRFIGADLWTAYELSWLNARGKPQVALAHITVPCDSPCIVESKSFKLYLNSFNQSRFDSAGAVAQALRQDLAPIVWQGSAPIGARTGQESAHVHGHVGVQVLSPEHWGQQSVAELAGVDLDRLDIECHQYTPAPELLRADATQAPVSEVLCSRLLKSNCLITGQPDWASVQISYSGPPIDQAGLLQYIVSFRQHNEFHEQCVERLYMDIWRQCQPTRLAVYARYTRRGGLDINPWRSSHSQALPQNLRTPRQ